MSTNLNMLPTATSRDGVLPPSRGWDEVPINWHGAAAGPSGIYSEVHLWTDSIADAGPSREYNIDLAPKVSSASQLVHGKCLIVISSLRWLVTHKAGTAWQECRCVMNSSVLQVATCAGSLVRALVNSGAHNYVEFKLLQGR